MKSPNCYYSAGKLDHSARRDFTEAFNRPELGSYDVENVPSDLRTPPSSRSLVSMTSPRASV